MAGNWEKIRWDTVPNRVASPDGAYRDLLDRAFGLADGQSYLDDFPVWDPGIAPAPHRYLLRGWSGHRLVTTASLRFATYRLGSDGESGARELSLGLIGAVATHPEFAKRGLASEALDLVLREGSKRGVELFALWGAASPLYAKRGFVFGGRQIRVPLEELEIRVTPLRGFDLRVGWDSAIAEKLLARESGVLYRDADVLWLSRHPNVQWRTLWIDGRCLAYCAWDRGIDLPNLIHEIGGSDEGMRELLRAMRDRHPGLALLAHPDRLPPSDRQPEVLAQFRFEPKLAREFGARAPALLDRLWFSGMDSC